MENHQNFQKAFEFDTIKHELLLVKLEKYGFTNSALELIKKDLSNRFSVVKFDGKKS